MCKATECKNSKLWMELYSACCITVDFKSVRALACLQYSVDCCAVAENPPLVHFYWSNWRPTPQIMILNHED